MVERKRKRKKRTFSEAFSFVLFSNLHFENTKSVKKRVCYKCVRYVWVLKVC